MQSSDSIKDSTETSITSELKTERSKVRRGAKRATYDKEVIYSIIDNVLMCHVAQSIDNQPLVIPTCHWRDGDYFYWHGLSSARNIRQSQGQQVCINIAQLDGLVLARSAFNHSVNYRSVTLFGTPEAITDEDEKTRQLKIFVDKVCPERWSQLRPITEQELKATGMVRIPISEAAAKVRTEPPVDEDDDYSWPVWAGVIPLDKSWGKPEKDPKQDENYEFPMPPKAF